MTPTIHASALLVGYRGILIRGPSGSGKSRLALSLLQSADAGFARLVGDDRIHLEARHGRLLMRSPGALAGLIEVRGLGILRMPFEPVAVAQAVVDLDAPDAARLADPAALAVEIEGVKLARLPVAPGADALRLLFAFVNANCRGTGLLPA
jgi:HPr kinase/phosphorylase